MIERPLDRKNLAILYYTLLYPHLTYGILLWGGSYKTYLKEIEIVQKKAIRAITNSKWNAHTNQLFKQLKMLKLSDIYNYYLSRFMFS